MMNKMWYYLWALFLVGCNDSESPKTELETDVSETKILVQIGAIEVEVDEAQDITKPVQVQEFKPPYNPYLKPGAPIRISHDYDGSTLPGETESFVLTLNPSFLEGPLDVQLAVREGMNLLVDAEQSFLMSGQSVLIPVSVSANDPGLYALSIVATAGSPMLLSSRVFSVSIMVGSEQESASAAVNTEKWLVNEDSRENVVSMPASEKVY